MESLSRRGDLARSAVAAAALRRQLASGGEAVIRVRGGSMEPLVPDGARVRLRPVLHGESLVRAIVAIDTGSCVAVHRVTRTRAGTVCTRGIARASEDPPWPRDAVIGVACAMTGPRGAWAIESESLLRRLGTLLAIAKRVVRVSRRLRSSDRAFIHRRRGATARR